MRGMSTVKLVVFDVAGTIIEDHGEVIDAFSAALTANGVPVSAAELKEFKGASKREVITQLVHLHWGSDPGNEERVDRTYAAFRSELEGRYANGGIKPIAGAANTFAWLKAHNVLCATTTGFYRSVTDQILDAIGWRSHFVANVSSDEVRMGRPAPYMIFRAMEAAGIDDVREVLNVGDTPLDIQAGHRAGVLGAIAVLTGVHTEARLRAEAPSDLIASVADLPSLIETRYSRSEGLPERAHRDQAKPHLPFAAHLIDRARSN